MSESASSSVVFQCVRWCFQVGLVFGISSQPLLCMTACLLLYYCSYPMQPPVVRFVTKVFHPNISRHGDVGLDSIHHNWSLALTISKVLLSIQSLLTDPYWYVCMEPTIGQMYRDNVSEFNRIARLWTWKYAMHDYLKPFSDSLIP